LQKNVHAETLRMAGIQGVTLNPHPLKVEKREPATTQAKDENVFSKDNVSKKRVGRNDFWKLNRLKKNQLKEGDGTNAAGNGEALWARKNRGGYIAKKECRKREDFNYYPWATRGTSVADTRVAD